MRSFLLCLSALWASGGVAQAACTLTSVQSISGTLVNTGAYVAGTGSTATVSLTIVFNKPSDNNGNGNCSGGIAFNGTLAIPQMTNGAATLNYTIPNYYTGTTRGTMLTFVGSNNNAPTLTVSVTTTLTVTAGQTGKAAGAYSDNSIVVRAFDGTSTTALPGAAPSLTVTATISNPTSCTIGGSASGGTQTLDFSNTSAAAPSATITTAQKVATFATVTCNNSATLTLTSSNGAAKTAGVATASHQNFFDYTATTTINGGTVTLNTATNAAVAGPEQATGAITAIATIGSALSIGVTPVSPAKPLVAGSYSDVLTLTITPN